MGSEIVVGNLNVFVDDLNVDKDNRNNIVVKPTCKLIHISAEQMQHLFPKPVRRNRDLKRKRR